MQKAHYTPRKKNVVFTLFSRFFYGVLSGAIFLIALVVLFFILSFNASLNIDKEELFEIKQGESLSKILNEAKNNGLIKSNISLLLYAVLLGIDREIQFGVYELKPGMNSYDFLLMISGKGDYTIKGNKITILEGYTIDDIFNVLQKNDIDIDYDIFINIDNNLRKKYFFLQDIPENASLEGFLFPDTYYFLQSKKQGSDIKNQKYIEKIQNEILEKFLDNFESKITNEIKNGFEKQGLNFYEGVILASIVEREVWNKNDKPIVASVLLNRLRVKMPIQVDSTIIYLLKSDGNNNFLTPKKTLGKQFLDIKSFYNTYKNSGLPPGPISNPGLDSLIAVANAPDTSFWYYLSRQDTGETIFSKNLDEHNKNRYKYLR